MSEGGEDGGEDGGCEDMTIGFEGLLEFPISCIRIVGLWNSFKIKRGAVGDLRRALSEDVNVASLSKNMPG